MGEMWERRKRQGEYNVDSRDFLVLIETQVAVMRVVGLLAEAIRRLPVE